MGLDGVELVMAVEEAFMIQIEDDAAAKMLTPRDVIDYVWRKVAHADAEGCQTQRAFHLLRKTLVATTGLPRRSIQPAASMNELIPKAERPRLRQQLSAIVGAEVFPEFLRPAGLVKALAGFSLCVGAGTFMAVALLAPHAGGVLPLIVGLIAASLAGYASAQVTRNLRTEFPPTLATVGDFSRWIMCHRRDSVGGDSQAKWTREQVSARVREIVVEQLDCAATYREDARFIEDLGLD